MSNWLPPTDGPRRLIMHDGSEAGSPVSSEHGPITIKKYANRRLYNTATSCYVTLDYLAQLVKTGAEFAVYDAKTGEDITRSVLTHIIVEATRAGAAFLVSGLSIFFHFTNSSPQRPLSSQCITGSPRPSFMQFLAGN